METKSSFAVLCFLEKETNFIKKHFRSNFDGILTQILVLKGTGTYARDFLVVPKVRVGGAEWQCEILQVPPYSTLGTAKCRVTSMGAWAGYKLADYHANKRGVQKAKSLIQFSDVVAVIII